MRKITVVRLGIAAALGVMGTAGAIGSGCTSGSITPDGGTPESNNDSGGGTGPVDAARPTDSGKTGPSDGGFDSAPPQPANLVLVHAAPGIPPFRVCFAAGASASSATVTPLSALPDTYPSGVPYGFYGQNGDGGGPYPSVATGTPGLYPGTIGAFPSLGLSYQNLTITPFLILASSVQNNINTDGGAGVNTADGSAEETCLQLIGTHGLGPNETAAGSVKGRLIPGTDFFQVPTIPSGTLKDAHTYLLSLNGCLPGGAYDPAAQTAGLTCGPGDAGPWIGIDSIDTTAVPDGGIGFQFANRSAALQYTPLCVGLSGAVPQPTTTTCTGFAPNGGYGETPASNGVNADLIIQTVADAGPDADPEAGPTFVETIVPLSPTAPSVFANALTPLTIAHNTPTSAIQLFGIITATADGGPPVIRGPGAAGYNEFDQFPFNDTIPIPASAVLESSGWRASTKTSSSPDGGFQNGASYTLVFMGDIAWTAANSTLLDDGGLNPIYDGRGLHLVAFPNVFTPQ